MPQSRVGSCAVQQACDFQGDIDFDNGVAVAHDNTAGTVFDPGTMEAQTELAPDHVSMPSVPTPHTAHSREKSRSPRRHVEEESFGLTSVHLSHQFGFRDSTLWCWRCGGWSAGSRRASRLKGPCGAPTKNGADVVYRVSGWFLPKARIWRSDDVSGAPERIPIIKNPYTATDTGHQFFPKMTVPHELQLFVVPSCWSFVDQGMAWSLGAVLD